MEYVRLEGTGAHENPTPFLSVLSTMLPHALREVLFEKDCMEGNKELVAVFRHNLRQLGREKAQHVNCDRCKIPVAEATQQLVPNQFGLPSVRCLKCKKNYCKRASCPMSMHECCTCFFSFCSRCNYCHQCFGCGSSYCKRCQADRRCVDCRRLNCNGCNGLFRCASCESVICTDCSSHGGIDCACLLCKTCFSSGLCSKCDRRVCLACNVTEKCSNCDSRYCKSVTCREEMKKCEGCGESFCVECKELEYCFMCNSNFCKEHNRMVDCKSWKLRHCRPCGHDRKRCSLCGVPCFEDCVCDKDEKLPTAKRAV